MPQPVRYLSLYLLPPGEHRRTSGACHQDLYPLASPSPLPPVKFLEHRLNLGHPHWGFR